MLKIMITCGAGFSSSSLVVSLNKQLKEKGLDERASFIFKPYDFGGIGDEVGNVDIVMLCPHLRFQAKDLAKRYPDKPFYVIPTRLYGLVSAEEFVEDAEDALAGWQETGRNPFYFDGEESAVMNRRTVSHRKATAKK